MGANYNPNPRRSGVSRKALWALCGFSFILSTCDVFQVGLGAKVDVEPPAVAILSPASNAYLRETATVTGTVADDTGITTVTVNAISGSQVVGSVSATVANGAWQANLDTSALVEGYTRLEAVAVDAAGKKATTSVSVNVDNHAPTVIVLSPQTVSEDVYNNLVVFNVATYDASPIESLEVAVLKDGAVVHRESPAKISPTWQVRVNVGAPPADISASPGLSTYSYQITARDSAGNANIYYYHSADFSESINDQDIVAADQEETGALPPDGLSLEAFHAKRKSGILAAPYASFQLDQDTNKPTFSISIPAPGSTALENTLGSGTRAIGYVADDKSLNKGSIRATVTPSVGSAFTIPATASGAESLAAYSFEVDLRQGGLPLPDGSYSITFTASDNEGNSRTTPAIPFIIDSSIPLITDIEPASGFIGKSPSATASAAVADDNDIGMVQMSVDGGATWSAAVLSAGRWVASTLDTSMATSDVELIIEATDNVGKTARVRRSYQIDTVAPVSSIILPADPSATRNGIFLVKGSSYDENGIAATRYKLGASGAWTTAAPSAQSWEITVDTVTATSPAYIAGNGLVPLVVEATDISGLVTVSTYNFAVDQSLDTPVIAFLNLDATATDADAGLARNRFDLSSTISGRIDDDDALASVEVWVDGVSATPTLGGTPGSRTLSLPLTPYAPGSHYLRVIARDDGSLKLGADVAAKDSGAIHFIIDGETPVMPATGLSPVNNSYRNTPNYAISGTAEDDWGVAKVEVKVNEEDYVLATFVGGESTLPSGKKSRSWTLSRSDDPDGAKRVTIRATDWAGKISTQELVFTVHTVKPTITFNAPTPAVSVEGVVKVNGKVTVSASVQDELPIASVEYRVSGGAWIPVSTNLTNPQVVVDTIGTATGTILVEFRATDPAGNEFVKGINLVVDQATDLPRLSLLGLDVGQTSDALLLASATPNLLESNPKVSGSIEDDDSADASTIEISIDNDPFTAVSQKGTNGPSVSFEHSLASLSEGMHSIRLRAKDLASAKAGLPAASVTLGPVYFFIDKAAPTLAVSLPPDGSYAKSDAYIRGTASDANGLKAGVAVKLGGTVVTTVPVAADNSWEYLVSAPADHSRDASYAYEFVALDRFGKESRATRRIIVDTTPPTLGVGAPTAGSWQRGLTMTASGSLSEANEVEWVEWSTDGGSTWKPASSFSATAWSAEIPLTALSEGAGKTLLVKARDKAQNERTASAVFGVDQTNPTTTVVAPSSSSGTFSISGMADDGSNQVKSVVISQEKKGVPGSTTIYTLDDINLASKAWSTPALSLDTGEYVFTIVVTDVALNRNSKDYTATVTIDKVAPDAVVVTAPGTGRTGLNALSGEAFTFSGSASDAGVGVAKVYWAITPSATAPIALSGFTPVVTTGGWSFTDDFDTDGSGADSGRMEGSWYLHVRAEDAAGNVTASAVTVPFEIDQADPSLAESSGTAASVTGGFALSGTLGDTNGIQGLSVTQKKDGGEAIPISLAPPTHTASTWTLTALPRAEGSIGSQSLTDGSYEYVVTVVDRAGKTKQVTRTIRLDGTPPELTLSTPNASGDEIVTSLPYTIRGTVADVGVGLKRLEYAFDAGFGTSYAVANPGVNWTASITAAQAGGQGAKALHVRAIDNLDQVTTLPVRSFYYDASPPTLEETAIGSGAQTTKSGDYELTVNASDSNGLKAVQIRATRNGVDAWSDTWAAGDLAAGSKTYTRTVAGDGSTDGVWVYTMTATDLADRPATNVYRTVLVDAQGPTGGISDPGNYVTGPSATLSGTADDGVYGSGIAAVSYRVDGIGSWQAATGSTNWTATVDLDTDGAGTDGGVAEGAHTLNIRLADAAGNTRDLSRAFTVDQGVPSLANIKVDELAMADEGTEVFRGADFSLSGSAVDTYGIQSVTVSQTKDGTTTDRTVTLGAGTTSRSWSASSAISGEGEYVYTIVVRDAAGRESTATRRVKIDTLAPKAPVVTDPVQSGNWYGGTTYQVRGTAEDNGSAGVGQVYYAFGDTGYTPSDTLAEPDWKLADGGASWSGTISFSGEGMRRLFVKAVDRGGKVGPTTTWDIGIDQASPAVAIDTPTGSFVKNAVSYELGGSATDGNALTIASITIAEKKPGDAAFGSPVAVTSYDAGAGSWSYTRTLGGGEVDGTYEYRVTVTDAAGKVSTAAKSLVLDRIAPVVEITSFTKYAVGVKVNKTVSFGSLSSDPNGIEGTKYFVTDAATAPSYDAALGGAVKLAPATAAIDTTLLTDGNTYYLWVVSKDKAGNEAANGTVTSFVVDQSTDLPVVTLGGLDPEVTTTQTDGTNLLVSGGKISGTVTDDDGMPGTGLLWIDEDNDGNYLEHGSRTLTLQGSGLTKTFDYDVSGLSDGAYRFYIDVADSGGTHNAAMTPVWFAYDTQLPEVYLNPLAVDAAAIGPYRKGDFSIRGTVRDANGVASVWLSYDDGATWTDLGESAGSGVLKNWSEAITSVGRNGSHTLIVKAIDTYGREGRSGVVSVVIDTMAPTDPTISAFGSSYYSTELSAGGGAEDASAGAGVPSSGIELVEYSLDYNAGTGTGTWNAANGTGTWYQTVAIPGATPEGTRTLYVRSKDRAGNYSNVASRSFTVDRNAPVLSETAYAGTVYKKGNFDIDVTLTDSLGLGDPGTKKVVATLQVMASGSTDWTEVSLSGNAAVLLAGSTGTSQTWRQTIPVTVEGNYRVSFTAEDAVGRSATPIERTVAVDSAAPTITAITNLATSVDLGDRPRIRTASYVVQGTASDGSGSGIKKVEFSLDSGSTWQSAAFQSTGEWSVSLSGLENTLLANFWVRAEDNAGNVTTDANTAKRTYAVDLANPVVTTDTGFGATLEHTNAGTVTISGRATDGNGFDAGDVVLSYTVGGTTTDVPLTLDGEGDWSWELATSDGQLDQYDVSVTATDRAGYATSVYRSFVVDRKAPTASIGTTIPAVVSTTSLTVVGSADDGIGKGVAEVWYTLDDGASAVNDTGWTKMAGPVAPSWNATISLGLEGTKNLRVRAKDGYGKYSSTVSTSFSLDTSAPTLFETKVGEGTAKRSESFTLEGTATDTNGLLYGDHDNNPGTPDVPYVEVFEGAVSIGKAEVDLLDGNKWAFPITIPTDGTEDGAITYTIKTFDVVNTPTTITRLVTIDTTQPSISDGGVTSGINATTGKVNGEIGFRFTAADTGVGVERSGANYVAYYTVVAKDSITNPSAATIAAWTPVTSLSTSFGFTYSTLGKNGDYDLWIGVRDAVSGAGLVPNARAVSYPIVIDQNSDRPIIRFDNMTEGAATHAVNSLGQSPTIILTVEDDEMVDFSELEYRIDIDNDGSFDDQRDLDADLAFTSTWEDEANWYPFENSATGENKSLVQGRILLSNFPQGLYRIQVRARDLRDPQPAWNTVFSEGLVADSTNYSWNKSAVVLFAVDYGPPTLAATSPVSGVYRDSVTLQGTASDGIAVSNVKYRLIPPAGASYTNVFTGPSAATVNFGPTALDVSGLASGEYTLQVVAKDDGNYETTQQVALTIDNTAPSFTRFLAPGEDSTVNGSDLLFKGEASDNVQVSKVYVWHGVGAPPAVPAEGSSGGAASVNPIPPNQWTLASGSTLWEARLDTTGTTSSAAYTLAVYFEDSVGNRSGATTLDVIVSQDADRPVIALSNMTVGSPDNRLGANGRIIGTVEDDDSVRLADIDPVTPGNQPSLQIMLDADGNGDFSGSTWAYVTSVQPSDSIVASWYHDVSALTQGKKNFKLRVLDIKAPAEYLAAFKDKDPLPGTPAPATNYSWRELGPADFYIDLGPPALSIGAPVSGTRFNLSEFTVSGSANDANGIQKVTVWVDNDGDAVIDSAGGEWNDADADGFVDSSEWTDADSDGWIRANELWIKIGGTPATGEAVPLEDGNGTVNFSKLVTGVADGTRLVQVMVYDKAYAASTRDLSVVVDTVRPTAAISNPPAGANVNGNLTFNGTADDLGGIVSKVWYSFSKSDSDDGAVNAPGEVGWTLLAGKGSWTVQVPTIACTDNADYLLRVRVEDQAGNLSDDALAAHSRTVRVNQSTDRPRIQVTSIVESASQTANLLPSDRTITGTIQDDDGVDVDSLQVRVFRQDGSTVEIPWTSSGIIKPAEPASYVVWSYTVPVGVADGIYKVQVRAYDTNSSTYSGFGFDDRFEAFLIDADGGANDANTVFFALDGANPEIPTAAPGQNFFTNGSEDRNYNGVLDAGEDADGDAVLDAAQIYFAGTASDGAGLSSAQLSYRLSGTLNYTDIGTTGLVSWTGTLGTGPLAEGTYDWRITAKDAFNKPNTVDRIFTFDKTYPAVIIANPGAGASVNGSMRVSGTATDKWKGVDSNADGDFDDVGESAEEGFQVASVRVWIGAGANPTPPAATSYYLRNDNADGHHAHSATHWKELADTSSWEYRFNTTGLDGQYTIFVTAVDNSGNASPFIKRTVTFNQNANYPVITLSQSYAAGYFAGAIDAAPAPATGTFSDDYLVGKALASGWYIRFRASGEMRKVTAFDSGTGTVSFSPPLASAPAVAGEYDLFPNLVDASAVIQGEVSDDDGVDSASLEIAIDDDGDGNFNAFTTTGLVKTTVGGKVQFSFDVSAYPQNLQLYKFKIRVSDIGEDFTGTLQDVTPVETTSSDYYFAKDHAAPSKPTLTEFGNGVNTKIASLTGSNFNNVLTLKGTGGDSSRVGLVEVKVGSKAWAPAVNTGAYFSSWSFADPAVGLAEGEVTVQVRVIDVFGKETVEPFIFKVDKTAPAIGFVGPSENSLQNGSFAANGSAAEDFSVDAVYYWIEDAQHPAPADPKTWLLATLDAGWSFRFDSTRTDLPSGAGLAYANGQKTIKVVAYDNAGNSNAASPATHSVYFDQGLNRPRLRLNGVSASEFFGTASSSADISVTDPSLIGYSEIEAGWRITFYDGSTATLSAFNTANGQASFPSIGTPKPQGSSFTLEAPTYTVGTIGASTVTAAALPDVAPATYIGRAVVFQTGAAGVTRLITNYNGTDTLTLSDLPAGVAAGSTFRLLPKTLLTSNPTLAGTVSDDDGVNTGTLQIAIDLDNDGDFADDGGYQPLTGVAGSGANVSFNHSLSGLAQGKTVYRASISFSDQTTYGVTSTTTTREILIAKDDAPPNDPTLTRFRNGYLDVGTDIENRFVSSTITLDGTAMDLVGLANIEVNVNAQGYESVGSTSPWSYSKSVGTVTDGANVPVAVRVTDYWGRQTVKSFNFKADTKTPTIATSAFGRKLNRTETIQGSAGDQHSAVHAVYRYQGTAQPTAFNPAAPTSNGWTLIPALTTSWSYELDTLAVDENSDTLPDFNDATDHAYYLAYTAVDAAGNFQSINGKGNDPALPAGTPVGWETVTINQESDRPVISFISIGMTTPSTPYADANRFDANPRLTGTVTDDDGVDKAKIYVSVDGGAYQSVSNPPTSNGAAGGTVTFSHDLTGISEGVHTISIRVGDIKTGAYVEAGFNRNTSSPVADAMWGWEQSDGDAAAGWQNDPTDFYYDTGAPVITLTRLIQFNRYGSDYDPSLLKSDGAFEVGKAYRIVSLGTGTNWTALGADATPAVGEWFTAQATGSEPAGTGKALLRTLEIAAENAMAGTLLNNDWILSGSAVDGNLAAVTVEVGTDGPTPPTALSGGAWSNVFDWIDGSNSPLTTDGAKTIKITATDHFGKTTVKTLAVTFDATAPSLSLIAPADANDDGALDASVNGTVFMSGTLGEAATLSYAAGKGFNTQAATASTASTTWSYNFSTSDVTLRNSTNSVILGDVDEDGIRDHEPYTDSNSNGVWDSGEPYTDANSNGSFDQESWTGDTNQNGVEDSGEIFVYRSKVRIRAFDAAGNVTEKVYTFNIDNNTDRPTTTINQPSSNAYRSGLILVSGLVSDDNQTDDGVDTVEIQVDVDGDGYYTSSFAFPGYGDGDTNDPFEDETEWIPVPAAQIVNGAAWSYSLNAAGQLNPSFTGKTGKIGIRARSIDKHGTVGVETTTVTVYIDESYPEIRGIIAGGADFQPGVARLVRGTTTIAALFKDDQQLYAAKLQIKYNQGTFSAIPAASLFSTTWGSAPILALIKGGTSATTYAGQSNAGDTTPTSITAAALAGKGIPTDGSWVVYLNGGTRPITGYNSGTGQISWSTAIAGLSGAQYFIVGQPFALDTNVTSLGGKNYSSATGDPDDLTVVFKATDETFQTTQTTVEFKVDNELPDGEFNDDSSLTWLAGTGTKYTGLYQFKGSGSTATNLLLGRLSDLGNVRGVKRVGLYFVEDVDNDGVIDDTDNYRSPVASWAALTTYKVGVYRRNGDNVYVSTTAGTSGSTAPTHGAGSVSDGGVTWQFVSDVSAGRPITNARTTMRDAINDTEVGIPYTADQAYAFFVDTRSENLIYDGNENFGDGDGYQESLIAKAGYDEWKVYFDTLKLPDGPFWIFAVYEDEAGNRSFQQIRGQIANNPPQIDSIYAGTASPGNPYTSLIQAKDSLFLKLNASDPGGGLQSTTYKAVLTAKRKYSDGQTTTDGPALLTSYPLPSPDFQATIDVRESPTTAYKSGIIYTFTLEVTDTDGIKVTRDVEVLVQNTDTERPTATISPFSQGTSVFSFPASALTLNSSTITATLPASIVNGSLLFFSSSSLPGGFDTGHSYFVVNKTGTSFQLSATSGGAGIPVTSISAGATYSLDHSGHVQGSLRLLSLPSSSFTAGSATINATLPGDVPNGTLVFFSSSAVPGGFTGGAAYFIRNKGGSSFQLSTTAAGAVTTVTSVMAGASYVLEYGGHIEEAGWSGNDGDPDLSGLVRIMGVARDNIQVSSVALEVSLDSGANWTSLGSATIDPNRTGSVETGYTYNWSYLWNTATITGQAKTDVVIRAIPSDGTGPATAPPTATVDVVPYITEVVRDTATLKLKTNRSKYGNYSVYQGETDITIKGYNLNPSAAYLYSAKTGGNRDTLTIVSGSIASDYTSFRVNTGASTRSGWFRILVNNVEAINNTNDNEQALNRLYGTDRASANWSDDRYFYVWKTGEYFGSPSYPATNAEHPTMTINPTNDRLFGAWSNYGTNDAYFGTLSSDTTQIFGSRFYQTFDTAEYLDMSMDATGNSFSIALLGNNSSDGTYTNGHIMAYTYDSTIYVDGPVSPNPGDVGNPNGGIGNNTVRAARLAGNVRQWYRYNFDNWYYQGEGLGYDAMLYQFRQVRTARSGNLVHVAYYDIQSNTVKYARFNAADNVGTEVQSWINLDGAQGDTDGGENTREVGQGDGRTTQAGEFLALAMDEDNLPLVVYYDMIRMTLRIARSNNTDPTSIGNWWRQDVFPAGDPLYGQITGKHISAAVDNGGYLHITFWSDDTGYLYYIKSSNNPENGAAYEFTNPSQVVDDTGTAGIWADLSLDRNVTPNVPYISYLNSARVNTKDGLKLAYWDSANSRWEYLVAASQYNVVEKRTSIEHKRDPGTSWRAAIGFASPTRFEAIKLMPQVP